MSLWVDKHRPRDLSQIDFHKDQANCLLNLSRQSNFPHLIFYGPSGAGKKTRIMCLLRELYGPGIERLKNDTMNFVTPSQKKIEIMTVGSNYHIEVNPSDAGLYDRVVVVDLIKQIAQTHQIDTSGQRDFKMIVLSEADEMTKDAQHALRRTMEKYMANCRIILCANSLSRILPAILSRCLAIRVPSPSKQEIIAVLNNTCKKENIQLPSEMANRIVEKSDRNLRRAILMLEACKVQQYPFTATQNIPQLDWQVYLKETGQQILSEQNPAKLEKVRERLYELQTQGIPSDLIFKGLVEELTKNCDNSLKTKVIACAALYEQRMKQGSKHIFHFEAFVAQFMRIYKIYLQDSLAGF